MTSLDGHLNAHDAAFGPCAVCGRETRGSVYWAGIGPSPAFFIPQVNKPFCSAVCSAKYPRQAAGSEFDPSI